MSVGSQINYKQLLDRYGRIQIPMIQRDYVQGRSTESEIRQEFLNALEQALLKPANDPTLPLNLDFIYGSVEVTTETIFRPLDGQQRLTTLFLLHWYLAWRDEQWDTLEQLFRANGRARFAYRVRPSSTEFFDALVGYHPASRPESVKDLAQLIADQPWYFRSWLLDPTIQSVLGMLEAVHQRFASSHGLFSRLIDEEHPAITFQLLDLENFGLSDDLYIKMNARGKPLTAFETFKARYEQELQGQFPGEIFRIGQEHFPVADYVARRMDTSWADLFWKLRDKATNLHDNALMNVFRALAIVTRNPDSQDYLDNVSKLRSSVNQPSYTDFHQSKWLDEPFTRALIHLLDSWSAESGKLSTLLPSPRYFDETAFFNKVVSSGANLTYTELVQFAAYVMFITEHHDAVDPTAFQQWMRIVYNLSVNTDYNRSDDFRRSVTGLYQMLRHSKDLLTYFAGTKSPASGFSEPQIAEEKLKAELILARTDWRGFIDRAEEHAYFRGQIGFLLDFSETITARTESEPQTWTPELHAELQASFQRHLRLAETMFAAGGLREVSQYRWQRALLCTGDYLLPRNRNRSFLVDSPNDEASWKRLLRGTGPTAPNARAVLRRLWEQLSPESPIQNQLDAIIENSQVIEPWRAALVHCPEAFAYCTNHCLRQDGNGSTYLLKRVQMNGTHAELFTCCLYSRLKIIQGFFSLLSCSYESVTGVDFEPNIQLRGSLAGRLFTLNVEYRDNQYLIRYIVFGVPDPSLEIQLKDFGFTEINSSLQMLSSRENIQSVLKNLDQTLLAYRNKVTNNA